jgi:hypothetical protein
MLPVGSSMEHNLMYAYTSLLYYLGQIYYLSQESVSNQSIPYYVWVCFYFFTPVTAVGNACDCGGVCLLVVDTCELLASRTNI